MLDVWPALPIFVQQVYQRVSLLETGDDVDNYLSTLGPDRIDNIIAALEHHDRVCEIELYWFPDWLLEQVWKVMWKPFPALTDFRLYSDTAEVVPGSFLGGSAPSLRTLTLQNVSFPALPKLLLSATDLRSLELLISPYPEYVSPHDMVACLSVMTRLNQLVLEFSSSPPTWQWETSIPPPSLTRAILPALTSLRFRGTSRYLENLVAKIDTPLLVNLSITFFSQHKAFNTPQLRNFISRTNQLQPYRADRYGPTLPTNRRLNCRFGNTELCRMAFWSHSGAVL
jgi:hypothetical protein